MGAVIGRLVQRARNAIGRMTGGRLGTRQLTMVSSGGGQKAGRGY